MFGKPVFLLTDILIFTLVFVVFAFFLYAMRKPHLRKPWQQVVRNKAGVISMIILSVYICITLLDSLHFYPVLENQAQQTSNVQYGGNVLSVFDKIVTKLRVHDEKTYSAPFATHLYVKETIQLPDGEKRREYPRLSWGGHSSGLTGGAKNYRHNQVKHYRGNKNGTHLDCADGMSMRLFVV